MTREQLQSLSIQEKIQLANEYLINRDHSDFISGDVRNDAANIYASNFEDYMAIWNAIQ